jgi:short-subunit dehydrogenase
MTPASAPTWDADRSSRPFAVVTGASTGIGLELVRQCAANGFDLLIAADEPSIEQAADEMRAWAPGCRR